MAEQISENTREKIQKFCRKISLTYDLDEVIQEELYGHIEDKMLDYLSGEEKLTENDAFVLVREHFGDPVHIKGLLREVHGAQVKGSLARRLGAVLVVTAVLEFLLPAINKIQPILRTVDMIIFRSAREYGGFLPIYSFVSSFKWIIIPLLLWIILVYWQKRINVDRKVWFQHIKLYTFLILFVAIVSVQLLFPIIEGFHSALPSKGEKSRLQVKIVVFKQPIRETYRFYAIRGNYRYNAVRGINFLKFHLRHRWTILTFILIQCCAWLWWCDMPYRRARSLLYTLGVWIFYGALLPLMHPMELIVKSPVLEELHASLSWGLIKHPYYISMSLNAILVYIIMGSISLAVYILMTKFRLMKTRMAVQLREQVVYK